MQLALLLLPLALAAVGAVVVVAVLATTARPDHTLPSEVASARRHGLTTSVLAQVAFVATAAALLWMVTRPSDGYVRFWQGALPLLGAAAALVVLALGELTWPRPRGLQRQANLNPRTIGHLVPRIWARMLVGLTVVTLVVIGLGWWAAQPNGHSLTVHHPAEQMTHTGSPFPGSDYGRLQLAALVATLLLMWLVLRLTVLRPAVVRSDIATDNRLRAASAVRAVRVVVSGLALTSAGNLVFGGMTAIRVHDPGWTQNLYGAGAILGVVLGLVGVGLVLAPAPRLPRPVPEQPTDVEVGASS